MRVGSGYARETFAVPAGSGSYAPETIITRQGDSNVCDKVDKLRVLVESLTATAEVELDLLKPGEDPRLAASWFVDAVSITAAGLATYEEFCGWPGVRIRAKSGGTAGSTIVSVAWS